MSYHKWMKNLTAFSIAGVMLALLFFTLGQRPTTQAQGETAYVRLVRVLEDDELLPGDDKLIEVLEKSAETLDPNTVAGMDLEQLGIKNPQGLTVDPTSGHLHAFSLANQKLYELSQAGQVLAVRDLSELGVGSPQSMVFAPSGDLTDDPLQMNLFIDDGEHIFEMSFIQVLAPAAPVFTSTLVREIDTTNANPDWSPYSSPDPSGIVYLPSSNSLLVSDSEINEMVYVTNTVNFSGVNVFESSLAGTLVSTDTTLYTPTNTFSDEPTGVTFDPSGNGRLFFSDDQGPGVGIYEIDLGPNGVYDFSDWPSGNGNTPTFRTLPFGSMDPEGVTYASGPGTLFIADDNNSEIYQVAPGPNGIFDGVPSEGGDDVVAHFDTLSIGAPSPEGIAYNPDNGHLYTVDGSDVAMFELTVRGTLYQVIDIQNAGANNPAGLAYGPSSGNPSVMSMYIAARGVDNNTNSIENDGRIYEMTLPPNTNTPPVAVDDEVTTAEDTPVTIDVYTNDIDTNLDPSSALTDTNICPICSGPANGTLHNNGDGTFVYTPTLDYSGPDQFVYEICDLDVACDTATVTITVLPNDPPVAVDDSAFTPMNTLVNIDVAKNDSDPDGNLDPDSANTDCDTCSEPLNGTLANKKNGTFDYTPDLNFTGVDIFVYEICDLDVACDTAKVTINVANNPPVAVDDNASTTFDTPVTIDVAANDSDPDGNLDESSANATCANGSTGCILPVNGMLVNNGNGTFDYTPDTGFTGADSFVYEICDTLGACDTATVDIEVTEHMVFIPLIIRN